MAYFVYKKNYSPMPLVLNFQVTRNLKEAKVLNKTGRHSGKLILKKLGNDLITRYRTQIQNVEST